MHIYTQHLTSRIVYVTSFLSEFYGCDFKLVNDKRECETEHFFINYSDDNLENCLQIVPHGLLSEQSIRQINPEMTEWNGIPVFFANEGKGVPFDLFSAIFYLISRYEEYLPHSKDEHGRFESSNSLAVKNGFIQKPVVDLWLKQLADQVYQFSGIQIWNRKYRFISTVDIDKAYAFLHQGLFLSVVGKFRALKGGYDKERSEILNGRHSDPFDKSDYFQHHHMKHNLKPIFFILVGDRGRFDKNLSIKKKAMKTMVKNLALWAEVGIHPSYGSFGNKKKVATEMNRLNAFKDVRIAKSRQHYLRFQLPQTYRYLDELGISEEYSLGYADLPGFRAGTCTPFRFFDLTQNKETKMKVVPLVVMDVTLSNYLGLNKEEARAEIKKLVDNVKDVDGTFVSLWHNSSFAALTGMKGWKTVFEYMLDYASS